MKERKKGEQIIQTFKNHPTNIQQGYSVQPAKTPIHRPDRIILDPTHLQPYQELVSTQMRLITWCRTLSNTSGEVCTVWDTREENKTIASIGTKYKVMQ